MEDAGTATVARVTGPVGVSPGDRVSHHTLTSPEDSDGWRAVETWESGSVEISIGRSFTASRRRAASGHERSAAARTS
ncbi:MAG TPA: hypothetical protein VML54_16015 [Candidatus Limnocylindrales bacterium]|nr:hypothetical protein [Candidatus Limnocylindrales bacterium]